MIDTFQIALDGITPNWKPWNLALKGFGFDVEVIVPPIPPSSDYYGGGWKDTTSWETAQPYVITVRVKYKDKTWEQKQSVSILVARSLEKVVTSFRRISSISINIYAKFKTLFTTKIEVKIKKI